MVDPRLKALHRLVSEDFDAKALFIVNIIKGCVPEGNRDGAMFLMGNVMNAMRTETLGIILQGLPSPMDEAEKKDEPGYFDQ